MTIEELYDSIPGIKSAPFVWKNGNTTTGTRIEMITMDARYLQNTSNMIDNHVKEYEAMNSPAQDIPEASRKIEELEFALDFLENKLKSDGKSLDTHPSMTLKALNVTTQNLIHNYDKE